MNLEILQDAEDDLNETVAYYEEIESGLGIRLREEVRAVIQWIGGNPEIPQLRPKGHRRGNLKVFRYYVAYFIWNDAAWILAVAHGSRRPGYWMGRKKSLPGRRRV